ncbi:MAG: pantoate--beta-alanine ligase [Thermotogae bacterium]|nr:pantoate--beta-alanine ligase [Thermotogota bacterium]
MRTFSTPKEMQLFAKQLRKEGKVIGFVPTMGALHEGHLRLIRKARREADIVVVSIFVNPTQFDDPEDFARYPRTFDEDRYKLEMEGVQVLFAPGPDDMYPPGFSTFVEVKGLDRYMEGAYRPGHFRGVTTVVLKLFNIVMPHFAIFGLKDAQQYYIIKRMVEDLNLDLEVVPHETVREKDGLALSSRNRLLSPESRKQATAIYRALKLGKELIFSGERNPWKVKEEMLRFLKEEAPLGEVDYVEIAGVPDLQPVSEIEGKVLLAVAVRFPEARLIDNFILSPDDRLVWNERIN